MGETTSDFMVHQLNPVIAVGIGALGLLIALFLQFIVKKYIPFVYWFAASMVAVFGTMAADVLHIGFGIPYYISSIFFSLVLIITFVVWFSFEKTLSIHSITTYRREIFYWITVLATFALGTAVGDMTAVTFGLGYLTSGIVFFVVILIPLFIYIVWKNFSIFCFWFAYIITRPLGASFSDWMGKPQSLNGLNYGTGKVSIVLTIVIFLLVVFMTITKKDVEA